MVKTIAIIGASGKMGQNIARSLAKRDYSLLLMGRDDVKLHKLLHEVLEINPELDAVISGCPVESCWEADLILLAIPYRVEKEIAARIKQVSTQKIVVSISNPINDACNGQLTVPGKSAAEELQDLLPHSKIVKAFNALSDSDFVKAAKGIIISSYIAGNNDEAVAQVINLVKAAGFHAVNAGNLAQSQALEMIQIRQTILADIGNRNASVE